MYSQSYKRYVTVLLLLVYIFNQVDRGIFGILMEPIKREFGLSDTQLGFLAGPALLIVYATLGIPVARWADRSHRINIMSVAIALWSLIVTLSAAVGSFWQFALARVGVGIGEAGFTAVAQSVIGSYNTGSERTRAMAVFMLGIPFGIVVSLLMGGWINEIWGWRPAFIAAGVPGLVLAVLVKWTVREPLRTATFAAGESAPRQLALLQIAEILWKRKTLRHLAIALTLLTMVTSSANWITVFFIRVHGVGTGEIGTWIAIVSLLGASIGAWLGVNLARRDGKWDERAQLRLLSISALLVGPLLAASFLWPGLHGALVWLLLAYVGKNVLLGPTWALLQGLCASSMRATVVAIVIFAQTTVAAAVGGQLIGILSDMFAVRTGSADSLRYAVLIITPGALWAALHFWLAARSIREDLQDVAAAESAA